MSFVIIKNVEGSLSPEEKQRLLFGVLEAVVSVKGEGNRAGINVVIEEVKTGDWAAGALPGRALTAEDVRRAGKTGQPPNNDRITAT